ncbi:MAG: hypothetical protein HWD59_09850 [Coxiellaceae bacterium]|nr:MAG: hypothetical protein HWD59_09850 [Coxiellaceae bacterium]
MASATLNLNFIVNNKSAWAMPSPSSRGEDRGIQQHALTNNTVMSILLFSKPIHRKQFCRIGLFFLDPAIKSRDDGGYKIDGIRYIKP